MSGKADRAYCHSERSEESSQPVVEHRVRGSFVALLLRMTVRCGAVGLTALSPHSDCPKIARFELCPGFTFAFGLM